MKKIELSKEVLRKAWSLPEQYWLSLSTFKVVDYSVLSELDRPEEISETAYFISVGYIPFFTVSNEEVMKAYVETIENKKLKEAFSKISEENYVESFWKYFKIYPEIFEGYNSFEDSFVLEKAKKWCAENGIDYIAE